MRDIQRRWQKEINGNIVDFTHLKPKQHRVSIEGNPDKGLVTLNFILFVRYSCHCYSEGTKRGEDITSDKKDNDHKIIDEKGNVRYFCPKRYKLSLMLPSIIENILNKRCYDTNRNNFLIIEFFDNDTNKKLMYEIFFNLRKSTNSTLSLYVESAYVRGSGLSPPKKPRVPAKKLFSDILRSSTS